MLIAPDLPKSLSFRSDWSKQRVSFDGLFFRNVGPTDCDLLFDVRGRGWIIGEFKLEGIDIPRGQEALIENAVDDWERGGRPAIGVVAEHAKGEGIIVARECLVVSTYWKGQWRPHTITRTFGELVESFYEWTGAARVKPANG